LLGKERKEISYRVQLMPHHVQNLLLSPPQVIQFILILSCKALGHCAFSLEVREKVGDLL
jgi:hypothetical protein